VKYSAEPARVVAADPPWLAGLQPIVVTGAWLAGFVDGEGNLGISGHGGALQPRFRVNQRDDDADLVRAIHVFLGVGSVRPRRPDDNPNACPQLVLTVVGAECRSVVEVFDVHPLQSKKRFEYPLWRRAVLEYSARLGSRWAPEITAERTRILEPLRDEMQRIRRYGGPR
jgi:hypothetical protein